MIVGVETCIEEFAHTGLDDVGELAGDDHQGLALGHHMFTSARGGIDILLTVALQGCKNLSICPAA